MMWNVETLSLNEDNEVNTNHHKSNIDIVRTGSRDPSLVTITWRPP